MKRIGSRANEQFKALRLLAASARERRRRQRTLLDGVHLLESYLDRNGVPVRVVVSEDACARPEIAKLLARVGAGAPVLVLPPSLFVQIASVDTPSGILAEIDIPQAGPDALRGELIVMLQAVQDPGNVGTIIRTAAGAGADAVLLCAQCADPWSPRVLRAAMGAHFALRVHAGVDLDAAVNAFRGRVIASAGRGGVPPQQVDLRGPVAFAFGSEGAGLSPGVLRSAAACVSIPLAPGIESLNVGAAAAVVLFERVRQCVNARAAHAQHARAAR